MRGWPGDSFDDKEEDPQRQDGDQEPGKDNAHHPQAKHHQGQILKQHFSLHGETHVNYGVETKYIRHNVQPWSAHLYMQTLCSNKCLSVFTPTENKTNHSPQKVTHKSESGVKTPVKGITEATPSGWNLGSTPCQAGWLHWLRTLSGEGFPVKTNQASPSSMSLEKRVRIRPRGVVSKKRMGLRRRRRNSLSWSTEAAFTVHCQHKQQARLNMRPDMCKQTTLKSIWKEPWLG